ncbi:MULTISPECIES: DUF6918 family protein [Sorangium]|uniref:Uncharacterized protein n=1 Tax=Sorangium atrum TaxID=2995308 RepID=A0ABT5C475_9BACT|nr:hypothetical protein [Sorangium aterium]MDC0680733.1 hypothetical protein [Sorangium aterium]
MGLSETLLDANKKSKVVADCCTLVDEEVASKSGLSGLAVKAGYAAVKGIKPGFIQQVVEKLLPEFAKKLDPIWTEASSGGNPSSFFTSNRSRIADALLSITDEKAKSSSSSVVRGTYEKLRGSAKKNVEEAVPRLAQLIQKHTA